MSSFHRMFVHQTFYYFDWHWIEFVCCNFHSSNRYCCSYLCYLMPRMIHRRPSIDRHPIELYRLVLALQQSPIVVHYPDPMCILRHNCWLICRDSVGSIVVYRHNRAANTMSNFSFGYIHGNSIYSHTNWMYSHTMHSSLNSMLWLPIERHTCTNFASILSRWPYLCCAFQTRQCYSLYKNRKEKQNILWNLVDTWKTWIDIAEFESNKIRLEVGINVHSMNLMCSV